MSPTWSFVINPTHSGDHPPYARCGSNVSTLLCWRCEASRPNRPNGHGWTSPFAREMQVESASLTPGCTGCRLPLPPADIGHTTPYLLRLLILVGLGDQVGQIGRDPHTTTASTTTEIIIVGLADCPHARVHTTMVGPNGIPGDNDQSVDVDFLN